jgi:hypothetical protein
MVVERWENLKKVNPNHESSRRLYGLYALEILNEETIEASHQGENESIPMFVVSAES